ncbi:MAG: HD-GYP domain-containing protein [Gemmatimonadetes bacterium]|nr:HD-GYP domain-containing protein [Gemmatimonadota bacterium]
MNPAALFLTSFAQAMSTMVMYREEHPARDRATDRAYQRLKDLQAKDPKPLFSFLGTDVVYGQMSLRELAEWDWGTRLANAGVQRLEFEPDVSREDFEYFLSEILARLTMQAIDTAGVRTERRTSIKFGAIGVRGQEGTTKPEKLMMPTATIAYTLGEEAETIRWMHDEVMSRGELPLMEAETVVRSLSMAMHGDNEIVIPLLQLREFDEYTTTHSLNVSVLSMALAEWLGMGAKDIRAFGVAGLLHDLGKVRIPKEILNKPGKLTDAEFSVMRRHPVDGAKIIVESDRQLDIAAVVAYEHHIMLNGGGYPSMRFRRDCHQASRIVHVCDVYDALRTNRPYREAWEADKVLSHIEKGIGHDFDTDIVRGFVAMIKQWDKRVAVVDDKTSVREQVAAPSHPERSEGSALAPAVPAPPSS